MFDNTKEQLIVICNTNYKNQLLVNMKRLVNIKFMSMDEFIKSYYFDYDDRAVLYLIKKYGIKYEIALEYLNENDIDIDASHKRVDIHLNTTK